MGLRIYVYLDQVVERNRSHSSSNFELSALPSIHLCVWLLENAVIHLWLFDLKSLFLSSKGNSPRKPFIVHNSKNINNINKTNNVTALHNSFISEKNNDKFKDKEILRETVQFNTKVQTFKNSCFVPWSWSIIQDIWYNNENMFQAASSGSVRFHCRFRSL